jgi:hypothetical protein
MEKNLDKINKAAKGFSVAKLLANDLVFSGIGSYLGTEILYHLSRLFNIPPWRMVCMV